MRPLWSAVKTEARKPSQFEGAGSAQFFERMEHHILRANAETFGFPLPVLRVAVPVYRMQRVLALHGEAACLVKLYCLPVLDNVVRLLPRVTLDVFIAQSTPREARKLIVAAGRIFTKEARNTCVSFAYKKTAIVSSHRKLALVKPELRPQQEGERGCKRKTRLQALQNEQVMQPNISTGVACIQLPCMGMKYQWSPTWKGGTCSGWPRRLTAR